MVQGRGGGDSEQPQGDRSPPPHTAGEALPPDYWERLAQGGLVRPPTRVLDDFEPLGLTGAPLSETILRDRR